MNTETSKIGNVFFKLLILMFGGEKTNPKATNNRVFCIVKNLREGLWHSEYFHI